MTFVPRSRFTGASTSNDEHRTFLYPIIQLRKEGEIDIPQEELIKTRNNEFFVFKSVNVIDDIDPSWYPLLVESDIDINKRLKRMYYTGYVEGFTVRPDAQDIFKAFTMPFTAINAVVIGQDPYPGWDKERKKPVASGYAFATESKEIPCSLQRIRESITRIIGSVTISDKERPNSLQGWIDQGVFLLNHTPVVYISYDDQEKPQVRIEALLKTPSVVWDGMTARICKDIVTNKPNCPFILMGSKTEYLSRIVTRSECTSHPSTRSSLDFTGECFIETPEIKWNHM